MTNYASPVVSSFSSDEEIFNFKSSGGQIITISGNNFGPLGTELSVTFGSTGMEYHAHSCYHTIAHTQLECVTSPSTGNRHRWIVAVANQKSSMPTTAVAPPGIDSVKGLIMHEFPTIGGEWVIVNGTNFGEYNGFIYVRYRNELGVLYEARNCSLIEKHKSIKCMIIEGYGEELLWQIVVDEQYSGWKIANINYGKPTLNTIVPTKIPTSNGLLTLYGENFGPSGAAKVLIDGKYIDLSRINFVSHKMIQVNVQEVNNIHSSLSFCDFFYNYY